MSGLGLTGALMMGGPKLPAQPLWAHTPGARGLLSSWPHVIRRRLQGISVGTAGSVGAASEASLQRNCSLVGQQGDYLPRQGPSQEGTVSTRMQTEQTRRRRSPREPQREWGSRLQAGGSVVETVTASLLPPPTMGCVHSSGCFLGGREG